MMKGYIYTVEVLIAISIVSVAFVAVYSTPPSQPELQVSVLSQTGHDALEYLDNKGMLRNFTKINDEAKIEKELLQVVENSVSYETEICDHNCTALNVPANKTVVVADYYVSSYRDTLLSKKVRIWLWVT